MYLDGMLYITMLIVLGEMKVIEKIMIGTLSGVN